MSVWNTLANAVADKYGVDVSAKDRLGKINEDRLNDRDIEAKEFKSGVDAVQFGGKGVGGNAVAKFGEQLEGTNKILASDTDADENGIADAQEAAEAFAAILNTLKDAGLTEEALIQDDLGWNTVAEAFGATFSRDLVNPDNSNFDRDGDGVPHRDFTNTFQNSQVVDEDVRVNLVSSGIGGGGGANAVFETQEDADAFIFAAEEAVSAELLGVKDSGESGTWNQVAAENDALSSRDTFTFNRPDIELGDDPEIEFRQVTLQEFGWTVQVGGDGVGGNATAKFNSEEEALEFEAFVDQLIDLGLTDALF